MDRSSKGTSRQAAGVEWVALSDGNEYRLYNSHARVNRPGKTEFVDRKVREALRALSGAEPDPSVIRLVHGRISALSQSDVPASIGCVRATFDFPVVTVPAMRPPSACPLRRDVVDPTRASIDKAVSDGTPWRRVTLRSALRDWETIYKTVRPHQALGYRTPAEYLASVGVEA